MGVSAGADVVSGTSADAIGIRRWVGTWSAGQSVPGPGNPLPFAGFNNQSVRMIVRTSISGESVRIRLANTFGDRHLTVGHATVALTEPDTPDRNDVDAATIRELRFGGEASVLVPKGSEALSDEVPMAVPARQELVVTLYLPTPTGPPTFHNVGSAFIYVGAGDQTTTAAGTGFTGLRTNLYFLEGVDVLTRRALGSVVALGDSITDGAFSTFNGYTRWTDRLVDRLQAERPLGPIEIGVLNQGIGGNQLAHDGSEVGAGSPALGVSGLARLDWDVFGQPGVVGSFVCLGINDIHLSGDQPERIIAGLRQVAAQLRAKGLVTVGCTITPFEGFVNWTPAGEVIRQAVNEYLRTTNDFHAVVDFDAVMRDPAQPSRLRPEFDSGDHIHPNPAGYTAMGDAISLRWFG